MKTGKKMLFRDPTACCLNYFWVSLFLWGAARYVYRLNARLPDGDPKKRNYHPAAVFLAPITWPLLVLGAISIFIVKAFLYGIFLILFTVAIVVIRKPFLIEWLKKIINFIGRVLLEVNTILIRLVIGEKLNLRPA